MRTERRTDGPTDMNKQIVTLRSFENALKNISKVLEKIDTNIMFNNISFFENITIYDIMWRNILIGVGHR